MTIGERRRIQGWQRFFRRWNPLPVRNCLGRCHNREDQSMQRMLVRYRAKPEKIEENQRLIGEVFRELHAKSPKDVRYLVLKLSDGTFCHVVEDRSKTIASLETFAASDASTNHNSSKQRSSAIIVCSPRPEPEPHGSNRKRHDGASAHHPGG